jgi:hypothetical protein
MYSKPRTLISISNFFDASQKARFLGYHPDSGFPLGLSVKEASDLASAQREALEASAIQEARIQAPLYILGSRWPTIVKSVSVSDTMYPFYFDF